MKKIAFLGLGIMGKAMAANMAKAGYPVNVWNRSTKDEAELRELGLIPHSSASDAVEGAEVVCSCVTNGEAVKEIFFGSGNAIKSIQPATIVVDFSTISPDDARWLHSELSTNKLRFIDAPVTGGDVGAKNGTLTIMCGGDQATFEELLPLFESVGKKIVRMGEGGTGQLMKAVNQIAGALCAAGMAEGFALGRAAGLDLEKVFEVLASGGMADSSYLRAFGPRVIKGDLNPGFHARNQLKDLRFAMQEAKKLQLQLPFTEVSTKSFEQLVELGRGELGTQALVTLYSK